MNHKVLLADDSLTIQKVIKITLANQPYDITDCSSEDELFSQLTKVQPKIVFLDFNLSENQTGYQLSSKIKELCPSTKILLLLGTFDTVDDAALETCGASEKIVKPFDSNKFIAICKKLVESSDDDESEEDELFVDEEEAETEDENLEDQWTVNHTSERKLPTKEETPASSTPASLNALTQEMSDWGMSVPGVIGGSSASEIQADLPPVIGGVKPQVAEVKPESKYETKFPENNDLDYPDLSSANQSPSNDDLEYPDTSAAEEKAKRESASAKLLSIDSFKDEPFNMEIEGSYVPDEADVTSIEAQIRDEVEGDLWKADEFEDLKREVSSKIEDMNADFQEPSQTFDENLFKPLDENESIDFQSSVNTSSVSIDDLRPEIENMVKKYVKQYMDEMFKKEVEKISWEVIPDLAENLIRQELGKISHKILNDQD